MKWAIFAISAVSLCAKNRGENVGLLGEIPAFEVQFRRKTHVFAAATMEKNNKNLCLLAETASLMSCLYAFFSKQAS